MTEDITLHRYLDGDYAEKNPEWDTADSPWKARKVLQILSDNNLTPQTVAEIGCGAGNILAELQKDLPDVAYTGYDIAPQLKNHWKNHDGTGIAFIVGDYFDEKKPAPDVILILDVIEHLGDPFNFLARLSKKSRDVVFHFPLDLSAMSVAREKPLLHVRDKVGHLHFYTKNLALELIKEGGFDIIDARYTDAGTDAPQRGLKTRIFGWVRKIVCSINRDFGVRLLGGETLMILARAKETK